MSGQKIPSPNAEKPLLGWLTEVLRPMTRTRVKDLLQSGRIRINGQIIKQFDHPLQPGDLIQIGPKQTPGSTALERSGIRILYEDEALIVIDKPAGLLAVATTIEKTDTAFARLLAHLEDRKAGRPYVVHRIDRETSGLLLFARSAFVRDSLQKNWSEVQKIYLAVVEGTPHPREGVVDNFLYEGRSLKVHSSAPSEQTKRAISRYRVLHSQGNFSLVEVQIETGRKHQIRVHLADLGHPVIGDQLYGARTNPVGRLGLHASGLSFLHPLTGQTLTLTSPIPRVLHRIVNERNRA